MERSTPLFPFPTIIPMKGPPVSTEEPDCGDGGQVRDVEPGSEDTRTQ